MSLKEKLLLQFKKQLICFIDELIDQFPGESDFIIMRILIKDQMRIEDIIGKFISEILPNKQDIKDRKNSFFIENNFLETRNGSLFKTLWESENIDEDDKKIIWKWMDLFVCIAQKYHKLNI